MPDLPDPLLIESTSLIDQSTSETHERLTLQIMMLSVQTMMLSEVMIENKGGICRYHLWPVREGVIVLAEVLLSSPKVETAEVVIFRVDACVPLDCTSTRCLWPRGAYEETSTVEHACNLA